MDETNMSDEKKLLLDYKERLVRQIEACKRDIDDCFTKYKSNRDFVDDSDSDSDNGLEQIRANMAEESSAELRSQCEQLQICFRATQELTGLQLYEKAVNVMVEPPQLTERYKNEEVPEGLWREVQTECRVDLVSFSLTFYVHQPYAKMGAPSYHNVRVEVVKKPHERELAGSVLRDVTKPSDAVQVLRSYALAHRSRRTTLSKLAEKYTDGQLIMDLLPDGGYLLKYGDMLELSWKLENKWSPIAPFYHRMKFELDYMDEQFIKTIKQANRQLQDPAVQTDERTFLLGKIIDTCVAAKQHSQTEESVDSDASQNVNRRTTLDHAQLSHQEAMPERKRKRDKDSEVMAPPKSLPKKARKGDAMQTRDDEVIKKAKEGKGDKLRALKENNSIFGTAKRKEVVLSGFNGQNYKGKNMKSDCAPKSKKMSEKTRSNVDSNSMKDILKHKTNAANRMPENDNRRENDVVNVKKTKQTTDLEAVKNAKDNTEKSIETNRNVVEKDSNKVILKSNFKRIDRITDKARVDQEEIDLNSHNKLNAQRKVNSNYGDKNAEKRNKKNIETVNKDANENNVRLEKNTQKKVNSNNIDKSAERRNKNDIENANKVVDQNYVRQEKNAQKKVNSNNIDKNAERRNKNDIENANKVVDQNNVRLEKNAQKKVNSNNIDKNAERRNKKDIENANKVVDQNNARLEKKTQKGKEITETVERNRDKDIEKAKTLAYKMSLQRAKLANKNKYETLNKEKNIQEKFVKSTGGNVKETAKSGKNLQRNNGNSQKSDPIRRMSANDSKKNQFQFENNAKGSKVDVEAGKKLPKNVIMQTFSKIPQKVSATRSSFENPLRNSPRLVKKPINIGKVAVTVVKPISKRVVK